jgi:integrase
MALHAKTLRGKGPGMHLDADGLYLQVIGEARSWVLRYQRAGRRRNMGLGSLDNISLAKARELAKEARALLDQGKDPIAVRDAAIAEERATRDRAVTFKEAAKAYIKTHSSTWKNAKHRAQWPSTLEAFAYPIIGNVAVADITVGDVRRVLEPIWNEIPETASRVRSRIETVINAARADDESRWSNPALWERHKHHFPAKTAVRKVRHHKALPYKEVPAFMAQLAALNHQSISSLALRFTILTAVRTSETTGATWAEIDLDNALWIIAAERMKAGQEHRVPLSAPALAILRTLHKVRPSRLVFPGWRGGRPLSDMAMLMCLRGLRPGGFTVHGFRSSFRDWAGEETKHDHDICEAALAHTRKDKTHAAYQRGDLLKKRRTLMDDWATYCSG